MGRNSSGEMGCGASVSSRFTFENLALEGIFDRDQGPHALYKDINDVGKALLEHQYQHATQLTLSFQYCDSFSDLSGLGTGLASLTALQKMTLDFRGCPQLPEAITFQGFFSRAEYLYACNHFGSLEEFVKEMPNCRQ